AAGRRLRAAGDDETRDRLHRRANRAAGPPHGARRRDHLGVERHGRRENGGVRAGGHRGYEAPGGRRAAPEGAPVKLRDVLKPEHIIVPLRAATVKEATERLAERLIVALAALDKVELPSQLTVRDVMTAQAITVGPERTLGDVARLMVEHDIRALPVVDDGGSLIGMITHRELLRFLVPHLVQRTKTGEFHAPTRSQLQRGSADPHLIPAREAMARSVLCLAEDQTLADVANLMSSKDVDRFPVVREGVVVGFLTRADVIRRLIAP